MCAKQIAEIYQKFPAVLRAKLINKEMKLPQGTVFVYDPIPAYRAISRNKNDNSPFCQKDVLSHADKGKIPKGIPKEKTIEYYAVSLYKNKENLKNVVKFPNMKIAFGNVIQENGPQHTRQWDGHINWWLYESIDLSGFIIEEN